MDKTEIVTRVIAGALANPHYGQKNEEVVREAVDLADRILAAMKRFKDSRKKPTSVALDETTIQELKALAEKQGIPYQVLIRVFILDGLERMKRAS